jgi:DNA-binding NtrC family response regulator
MKYMETRAALGRSLVLCVDDDVSILSSLERLLKGEPYVLRTTRKPMDILDWLREEEVSLVISDQKMPEMMGTDLLDRVHQISPTTARMLLTGYPGCNLLIKSTLLGIQAICDKSWGNEALRRKIRTILSVRAAKVDPRVDREDVP